MAENSLLTVYKVQSIIKGIRFIIEHAVVFLENSGNLQIAFVIRQFIIDSFMKPKRTLMVLFFGRKDKSLENI